MIKYDSIQKRYIYNSEDIDKIIELIQNGNFYNMDNCTQENITAIIKSVENFISNMEIVYENVTLERHETEEEAREYFGTEFITEFEKLLTTLDNEETIVAIHGTNVDACPGICEEGLRYKNSSLSSTAVQQNMAFGQKEMHYDSYESLLNWKHRNYKGLVILAIPYECYYKEGLWNHFQETNTSVYGGQDYKIDPDFVVGYIDVTNKQIVMNPKYSRQHNYDGYVKDNELFREQLDMDNNKLKEAIIEAEEQFQQEEELLKNQPQLPKDNKEEQIDISNIPYIIDDLIGTFNSIKNGSPNGMTEKKYNYLLKQLSAAFNDVRKAIPLLKTNEEVKKEQEERNSSFNDTKKATSKSNQNEDFDWEDFDWDYEEDEKNNKTL